MYSLLIKKSSANYIRNDQIDLHLKNFTQELKHNLKIPSMIQDKAKVIFFFDISLTRILSWGKQRVWPRTDQLGGCEWSYSPIGETRITTIALLLENITIIIIIISTIIKIITTAIFCLMIIIVCFNYYLYLFYSFI